MSRSRKRRPRASAPPAAIRLSAGEWHQDIDAADLATETFDEARGACNEAGRLDSVAFRNLGAWHPKGRFKFLEFLYDHPPGQIIAGGKEFDDVFEAVLACIATTNDLGLQKEMVRGAMEAGALFHADAAGPAAAQIKDRLKEVGLSGWNQREIAAGINRAAGNGRSSFETNVAASPEALAHQVLARMKEQLCVEEDRRVLWYMGSTFYQLHKGGKSWRETPSAQIKSYVARALQGIGAPKITESTARDVLLNLSGIARLDAADHHPPFHVRLSHEPEIDPRPCLVFENGVLFIDDLDNPEFVREVPGSALFNLSVMPYSYDPDASCPCWLETVDRFLPRVSDDDHRQQMIQQYFGYCFEAHCAYEKAMLLFGDGATGRSTLIKGVEGIVGSADVTHIPFSMLSREFRLASLRHSRLNVATELGHMSRTDEGILKTLISGEPINSNEKFRPPGEMRSIAKHLVACNKLPAFSDYSEGLWRRLIIVPFDNPIRREERIPHYFDGTLKQEMPGVLNWALEGARQLRRANGRFVECGRCSAALDRHRSTVDIVRDFLATCTRRVERPRKLILQTGMHNLFRLYCVELRIKPLTVREFRDRAVKPELLADFRPQKRESMPRPWLYKNVALTEYGENLARRLSDAERDISIPLPPDQVREQRVGRGNCPDDGDIGDNDDGCGEDDDGDGRVDPIQVQVSC